MRQPGKVHVVGGLFASRSPFLIRIENSVCGVAPKVAGMQLSAKHWECDAWCRNPLSLLHTGSYNV